MSSAPSRAWSLHNVECVRRNGFSLRSVTHYPLRISQTSRGCFGRGLVLVVLLWVGWSPSCAVAEADREPVSQASVRDSSLDEDASLLMSPQTNREGLLPDSENRAADDDGSLSKDSGSLDRSRAKSKDWPEELQMPPLEIEPPQALSDQPLEPIPSSVTLNLGEIRSLAVNDLKRVAVGNPDVVDVTVPSSSEMLLQAKSSGMTNLILWDQEGQHVVDVEVVDRAPAAREIQLTQLLRELRLPEVRVTRENGQIFLMGQVATRQDAEHLEQMLSSFDGVTNLVTTPSSPPPAAPAPLVKLSVQVVELSRKDLEKLGVKWAESASVTQPEASGTTAQTLGEALSRWGTGLTRSSVAATLDALVRQNRARILSEPKLVTASGKEASSFIGLEVPILTATSFSTTTAASSASIEFKKTGVLLKMTPTVTTAEHVKKITTIIEAEVSSVDNSVALKVPVGNQSTPVPGFKVRKANTEVTTNSGETIMIAGLLAAEDSKEMDQVPGIGSVPFVGRLFRSPVNTSTQQELVITVTPELLAETEVVDEKADAVDLALAIMEPASSHEDPTLRYALQVQDRIAKALQYPVRERILGKDGQVKLRLHLRRDGTLEQAVVAEPSGVEAFDAQALQAAESQSPYPAFPPELAQQELWLELPVLFRL